MQSFDLLGYLNKLERDAGPFRIMGIETSPIADDIFVIKVGIIPDLPGMPDVPQMLEDNAVDMMVQYVPDMSILHMRVGAQLILPPEYLAAALEEVNGANYRIEGVVGRLSIDTDDDGSLALVSAYSLPLEIRVLGKHGVRASLLIVRSLVSRLAYEICAASVQLTQKIVKRH